MKGAASGVAGSLDFLVGRATSSRYAGNAGFLL